MSTAKKEVLIKILNNLLAEDPANVKEGSELYYVEKRLEEAGHSAASVFRYYKLMFRAMKQVPRKVHHREYYHEDAKRGIMNNPENRRVVQRTIEILEYMKD